MISKGDRVQHKSSKKTGTALRDEHDSGDRGKAVYVAWDGATRPSLPTNTKNLIKLP